MSDDLCTYVPYVNCSENPAGRSCEGLGPALFCFYKRPLSGGMYIFDVLYLGFYTISISRIFPAVVLSSLTSIQSTPIQTIHHPRSQPETKSRNKQTSLA